MPSIGLRDPDTSSACSLSLRNLFLTTVVSLIILFFFRFALVQQISISYFQTKFTVKSLYKETHDRQQCNFIIIHFLIFIRCSVICKVDSQQKVAVLKRKQWVQKTAKKSEKSDNTIISYKIYSAHANFVIKNNQRRDQKQLKCQLLHVFLIFVARQHTDARY